MTKMVMTPAEGQLQRHIIVHYEYKDMGEVNNFFWNTFNEYYTEGFEAMWNDDELAKATALKDIHRPEMVVFTSVKHMQDEPRNDDDFCFF